MVEWTEQERAVINNIFATLDYDDIGPKALVRYATPPETQNSTCKILTLTRLGAANPLTDSAVSSPCRCLIVYPWTQRYFDGFGNLYNAEAIRTNDKIAKHGKVVLHGLDRAVKNMDNIKATYTELSILHSENLRVDPDNFKVKIPPLKI